MVTVMVLGNTLREAVGEHELEVELASPTTVKKLIESHDQLSVLLQFLANRTALITVNKKIGSEDSPVKDGDLVKLSCQASNAYDGTRDIPM